MIKFAKKKHRKIKFCISHPQLLKRSLAIIEDIKLCTIADISYEYQYKAGFKLSVGDVWVSLQVISVLFFLIFPAGNTLRGPGG